MEEKLIVSIVRSRRRTMSLEIGRDLKVIVRVPLGASRREIEAFVHSKEDWIRKSLEKMKARAAMAPAGERLSMEEIRELASRAMEWFPGRAFAFFRRAAKEGRSRRSEGSLVLFPSFVPAAAGKIGSPFSNR